MEYPNKQIISIKSKLMNLDPVQEKLLASTGEIYRDGWNMASNIAFDLYNKHGSSRVHRRSVHTSTYRTLREELGISSQMACNIGAQVLGTFKSEFTKQKKDLKSTSKRRRKPRLLKAPTTSRIGFTLSYKRDFRLKPDHVCKIRVCEKINGEMVYSYVTCNLAASYAHLNLLDNAKTYGIKIGAARVMKITGQWYIIISVGVPLDTVNKDEFTNIIGVDVNIRNFCATSNRGGSGVLYDREDADVVDKWNERERVRQQVEVLKSKGTRSSKRKLRQLDNKEKRLNREINHLLSARIVSHGMLIGCEKLTDIRDAIERDSDDVNSAGLRNLNRSISQWSFHDLQSKIGYKTWLGGGVFVRIDPRDTSKKCPKCGHANKANRPNNGLMFICKRCKFTAHADIVGAHNIKVKTVKEVKVPEPYGPLSMAPTEPTLILCSRRVNSNVTVEPTFKWYNKCKHGPLVLGN